MTKKLPDSPKEQPNKQTPDGTTYQIENLHLQANDIDALRRLSETDPELARTLVNQKDTFDRREHASFRLGMVITVVLVLGILFACSYILVKLGVLLSILLIGVIVACALIVRVVLTGEWSETSWIGGLISGVVKIMGGKARDG